jgi:hypothetical protein
VAIAVRVPESLFVPLAEFVAVFISGPPNRRASR